MSVIIAVKHNGALAIAADSLWARGWNQAQSTDPKVVRRDKFLLTVGNNGTFAQALWEEILCLAAREEDWPSKWSRHCLSGSDDTPMQRLHKEHPDVILVGWGSRLFRVYTSGSIFEDSAGIDACGCGEHYARAIAYWLKTRQPAMSAVDIAKLAAETTCELSAGCALPIIVETIDVEC